MTAVPEPLTEAHAFARWPGPGALVGVSRIDPRARTLVCNQVEFTFDDVTCVIVGGFMRGTILIPWAIEIVVRSDSKRSIEELRAEIDAREGLSDDDRAKALFELHESGPNWIGDSVWFAARISEPRAWRIGECLARTLAVPLLGGNLIDPDRRDPDQLWQPFAGRVGRGPTPPPAAPIPGGDDAREVDIVCVDRPDRLHLQWQWKRGSGRPLLILGVVALSVLVSPGLMFGAFDLFFAINAALTVAIFGPMIGLIAAYSSPRTLELTDDTLTVIRHWPWKRTRSIATSDLLAIRVWAGSRRQIRFRTRGRVLGVIAPFETGRWIKTKITHWLWRRQLAVPSRPPQDPTAGRGVTLDP